MLGFRRISTDSFVFEMWLLMGFALKRYGGTANDANFSELNRKFSFGKRKRLHGGARRNRNVYRLHFFSGWFIACLLFDIVLPYGQVSCSIGLPQACACG